MTEPKKKIPKTPSPGQLRAVAQSLASATIPSDAPLLREAHDDVGAWLIYQADLKAGAR